MKSPEPMHQQVGMHRARGASSKAFDGHCAGQTTAVRKIDWQGSKPGLRDRAVATRPSDRAKRQG